MNCAMLKVAEDEIGKFFFSERTSEIEVFPVPEVKKLVGVKRVVYLVRILRGKIFLEKK